MLNCAIARALTGAADAVHVHVMASVDHLVRESVDLVSDADLAARRKVV
jgi:hypothetical protein